MLQSASRLTRQAGDAQRLFDDLVLEAHAFTAVGGRSRASELIDEAVAVAQTRPVAVSSYFQLGHLMARIGRLNGAREVLRLASQRVAQDGRCTLPSETARMRSRTSTHRTPASGNRSGSR
jgi:hypothetical protein